METDGVREYGCILAELAHSRLVQNVVIQLFCSTPIHSNFHFHSHPHPIQFITASLLPRATYTVANVRK